MSDKQLAQVAGALAGVHASLAFLGPLEDLGRQINECMFVKQLADLRSAIARSKPLRDKVMELLEQPKTEYDDAVFSLYAVLETIATQRHAEIRALLTQQDRTSLRPYASRAADLALCERSARRLASGLCIRALVLAESDDYRDVMCGLAPAHIVASESGFDTAQLFADAATFAPVQLQSTFMTFGKRTDVTAAAFGLVRVDTANGPRFRQNL